MKAFFRLFYDPAGADAPLGYLVVFGLIWLMLGLGIPAVFVFILRWLTGYPIQYWIGIPVLVVYLIANWRFWKLLGI